MEERLFFDGLHALAASAFPKHCNYCGRVFATATDFMRQTQSVRQDITGLKQSFDDDSVAIVEAYRNCPCGSTLMDFFSDRRDVSEAGGRRRELFDKLLPHLEEKGMDRAAAREHLLRLLRGRQDSGNMDR
ncbi:oxidoreductase [Pseudoduganella eburnea]|uniref:Oxidoreductase n=1 Tax=Massilia eburnea TaxID=1776165 RepID=A0A6L6QBE2_9BURK|nr:oxidoreductase [Massilia eburnea]MTW09361.1 oxidoreductase [Massilia eburnea]